ncbi:hypothetical protein [Aquimarina sp. I32.4]|uniref:hypothetical protein n=1 Tax=Aquimarina sp. I32.4 TaxID=2053903 RepID=UPI000CDEC10E|nr:hypothetical protein [Aquimarina sp. I32.4]
MNYSKVKKKVSILFILIGAIAIISEISSNEKNYYIQSAGLVFLMLGIFWVNTNVKSKTEVNSEQYIEEEE